MSNYVTNLLAVYIDIETGLETEGENRITLGDIEAMVRIASEVQPKSVVDIGTYRGKSAKIWRMLGAERVYTIDLVNPEIQYPGIDYIQGDSGNIPWDFSVDVVWIDGDHEIKGVRRDLCHWMPWAKDMICGHDYGPGTPGVVSAVDGFFGKKSVEVDGVVWKVRKT
jgi:hypothetical protein